MPNPASLRASAVSSVRGVVEKLLARHTEQLRDEIRQLREEVLSLQRAETQRVIDHLTGIEIRDRRDLYAANERIAVMESARFASAHLSRAPGFPDPHETLRHALSLAPTGGLALEFGVATGGTLRIIAQARGGHEVYGFDTFTGLPDSWRLGFLAGRFGVDGRPDVPGAELVEGLFADTLPGFLDAHPGPVDFLHVDGDLYSSAVTVLDLVGPRLQAGSVIQFDEYFNFASWQEHEFKAWAEYVEAHGIEFEYAGFTFDHEQVAVRLTRV